MKSIEDVVAGVPETGVNSALNWAASSAEVGRPWTGEAVAVVVVPIDPARAAEGMAPRARAIPKASVSLSLFMALDLPGLIIEGSSAESLFERVDP